MRIVHIYPTDIYSQTRLFKEANYVLKNGIAETVHAIGLWIDGRKEQEQHPSGLKIVRIRTKLRQLFAQNHRFANSFSRRFTAAFSYGQFFFLCYREVSILKPDIVTCHYVSDLPWVCFIGWLNKCQIVYLPHELETERSGLTGFPRIRDKIIENLFVRFARDVVVVCEPIANWYRQRYKIDNVHVVRNAPEREAARIKGNPVDFRQKFSIPQHAIIFIYQGMFGKGRGTRELLEAFSKLVDKDMHLVLMGFGSADAEDMVKKAALRSKNIHYQEPVSQSLITSYSSGADIGVIVSEGNSLSYELSLPNKFFEYIHANLPILVSGNLKYLASLISKNSLGSTVTLTDLAENLAEFSASDVSIYKECVRKFAENSYWEDDADVFAKVYRRI